MDGFRVNLSIDLSRSVHLHVSCLCTQFSAQPIGRNFLNIIKKFDILPWMECETELGRTTFTITLHTTPYTEKVFTGKTVRVSKHLNKNH